MKGILNFFGNNVNGNNVMNANDGRNNVPDTPHTDGHPVTTGRTSDGGNGTIPTGDGVQFSLDDYKRKAVGRARKYYKGSVYTPFKMSEMSDDGKARKKALKDWTDKTTSLNGVGRLLFVFTRAKDSDDDGLLKAVKGTHLWDILKSHTAKEDFKSTWFDIATGKTGDVLPCLLHTNDDGTRTPCEYVIETYGVVTGHDDDGNEIKTYYDVYTTTPTGDVIPSYVPRPVVRWTVVKAVQFILDDNDRRKKTGDTVLITDGQKFYFTPDGERHDIPTDETTDTPDTDDTPHDPVTGDDIPTDETTPDTDDTTTDTNDTPDDIQ